MSWFYAFLSLFLVAFYCFRLSVIYQKNMFLSVRCPPPSLFPLALLTALCLCQVCEIAFTPLTLRRWVFGSLSACCLNSFLLYQYSILCFFFENVTEHWTVFMHFSMFLATSLTCYCKLPWLTSCKCSPASTIFHGTCNLVVRLAAA